MVASAFSPRYVVIEGITAVCPQQGTGITI
jgi:hypothetical protein